MSFRLERAEQLNLGLYRYTVWINGQNVGLIANGATNTFHFIPKISEKNAIYIEAYQPIGTNPVSNTLYFDIGSGGEMIGTVKWEQNGWSLDLKLEASVVSEGKYPPARKK